MSELDFEQEFEQEFEPTDADTTTITRKERERAALAMDVEAFLKNGGKVVYLKNGESSDLYGVDPSKEEIEALNKRFGKVVKITFCPVEKQYKVRGGRRVAHFCTEYAMKKYIGENYRI